MYPSNRIAQKIEQLKREGDAAGPKIEALEWALQHVEEYEYSVRSAFKAAMGSFEAAMDGVVAFSETKKSTT